MQKKYTAYPIRQYILILFALILTACEDKALVNIYNKKITQTPLTCMKLRVSPEDPAMAKTLNSRYHFDDACDLTLEVSYKSGIVCNSSYNAAQKTLGTFPNSYLKMELRRGMALQYSYYIDLTSKPTESDVNNGFDRLKKDMKLP